MDKKTMLELRKNPNETMKKVSKAFVKAENLEALAKEVGLSISSTREQLWRCGLKFRDKVKKSAAKKE